MTDVIERLEDLAHHLAWPEADMADAVVERLRDGSPQTVRRQPSRVLVLAAAALVVIAVVLAVPSSRHAVARWFGIGAVRFQEVPALPEGLSTALQLGREVTLEEGEAAAGRPLLAPPELGPPAKAFAGEPSADSVSLVWAPTSDIPEVGDIGVGALLTAFRGSLSGGLVAKELADETRVEPAEVDGRDAYWITGAPHTFAYLDPAGEIRNDSTRLVTGNTLLWVEGTVTYRLEMALDLADAVDLAESLEVLGVE